MGLWARTGRLTRALLFIAAGAAGGGAAIAVASVPDSNGLIHACYNVGSNGEPLSNATLTVIDPSAGQNCAAPPGAASGTGQKELSWNQSGPPGPPGPAGPPGSSGAPGAPGQTATVVGGPPPLSTGGGVVGEAKFGTGPGASTFKLLGLGFGASRGGTSGSSSSGSAAGKANVHEFTIKKMTDTASPLLFEAGASGKSFPQVTVTLNKKKQKQPYLVITMTDVVISSYQTSSKAGSSPQDTLSLNFTKIKLQYKAQSGKGNAPPLKIVKVLSS
jgi:type VI secretion system secreted protein Hcp